MMLPVDGATIVPVKVAPARLALRASSAIRAAVSLVTTAVRAVSAAVRAEVSAAMLLPMVVTKSASSPTAAAISFRVSRSPGAPSTRALVAAVIAVLRSVTSCEIAAESAVAVVGSASRVSIRADNAASAELRAAASSETVDVRSGTLVSRTSRRPSRATSADARVVASLLIAVWSASSAPSRVVASVVSSVLRLVSAAWRWVVSLSRAVWVVGSASRVVTRPDRAASPATRKPFSVMRPSAVWPTVVTTLSKMSLIFCVKTPSAVSWG